MNFTGPVYLPLDTAELYDPATQKFTTLGTMNDFHDFGAAVLIVGTGTPLDGQVLIIGGFSSIRVVATAELYDPAHQTFTSTAQMNFAHGERNAAAIP